MRKTKVTKFISDHSMSSREIGETLIAKARAEFDLAMAITSDAPLERIKELAFKLCEQKQKILNLMDAMIEVKNG